jgi:hypothetical protein
LIYSEQVVLSIIRTDVFYLFLIDEMLAKVQERLTRQIVDAVWEAVHPLGAGVVLECRFFF